MRPHRNISARTVRRHPKSSTLPAAAVPGRAFTGREVVGKALAVMAALALASVLSGCGGQPAGAEPGATPATSPAATKPAHVFVINLENTSYDRAWGAASQAPYLSQTLRQQGVLLTAYYAVAPSSLPNYIAQISGQGPNPKTMNDCAVYHEFTQTGTAAYGQLAGFGCLYPDSVPTIAGQLSSAGLTWKGYMEDMGTPCRHPKLNAADATKTPRIGDQYGTRHNPFVYFAAITGSPDCAKNVVDLSALTLDLKAADTTPNLSYITPNTCSDGHDAPCIDGTAGGLPTADAWLKKWVPAITASPAFMADGMLIITFDEGDKEVGENIDRGAPLQAVFGPGGGKVGALVISPFVRPNTSSDTLYNHYSLLASIEDTFSLPHLGMAGVSGLNHFGTDVYSATR